MTLTKGKTLSFRIPVEFDDKIVDILSLEKEKLGKGFSKYLANLVSDAIQSSISKDESDVLKINVAGLSSQEKKWLNNTTNLQILIKLISNSTVHITSPDNHLEVDNSGEMEPSLNNNEKVIEPLHNTTEDFILSQFLNL